MLRQDVTTNNWVVLAPRRAARPHRPQAKVRPDLPERDPACPFCPGNEDQTPPEIARRGARGSDWEQRVFPNLYPALDTPGDTERKGGNGFRQMAGIGSHEVVVESPRHDERMSEMSVERIVSILGVWRERYLDLASRPWAKAVLVFKNYGETAGTSLVHPHSQIVATPVSPPDTVHRLQVAHRYHDDTGHSVYEDLREAEVRRGERIVGTETGFVALAPFAARTPFETWIMPTEEQASFGDVRDDQLEPLAGLIGKVLMAVRVAAGDPDYNLIVQSAPVHEERTPYFLWHLQLIPRMSTAAGFELGSGMSINTVAPEDAATALREAADPRDGEAAGEAR